MFNVKKYNYVDITFAFLRVATIIGGSFWIYFSPAENKNTLINIFIFFCIYSSFLYLLIFISPKNIRKFYFATMFLDLIFISFLIEETGGMQSNFYLAFYLLIALHSFYYGVRVGVLVVFISSILYFSQGFFEYPKTIHWTDLGLRLSFFYIVGISLGLISEREKKDKNALDKAYKDIKSTHEKLTQSEKMASIGTLSAGIAHEINNPLDGIQNCIKAIIKNPEDKGLRDRYLLLVQDGLSRIENIVRKLLDFARPKTKHFARINVNNIIEKTTGLVEQNLKINKITLKKHFNVVPEIVGDSDALTQVFLNVILNAINAIQKDGEITIRTTFKNTDDNLVSVSISDTGCGIAKDNLKKIFDPFFSSNKTSKGTGLGLSISFGIIKEHGGNITVDSMVGKGSTFTITFPGLTNE